MVKLIRQIMEITNSEIDKMYKWIQKSMKIEQWYPVKTDKAYEILNILFEEGLIDDCEFNSQETHIRKVVVF